MKRILLLLSTCAGLFLAQASLAQSVVGTAVLDGRKVHLLDDGSWQYAVADGAAECLAIHPSVSFCDNDQNWRADRQVGDFEKVFNNQNRTFAGVIIEKIGRNDGVNLEFMRATSLENAAMASGTTIEQIPVIGIFERKVDGSAAETLVYGADMNGVGVVFANTFVIRDELVLQAVVWSIGKDFTQEHERWNSDFLDNLQITEE